MSEVNEHLMLQAKDYRDELEENRSELGKVEPQGSSNLEEYPRRSWRMAFVDLQILSLLRSQRLTGYSIRKNLNARFGILISFGTLYPRLKFLERIKVLKSVIANRSPHSAGVVTYELTEKGFDDLRTGLVLYNNSLRTMEKILDVQAE